MKSWCAMPKCPSQKSLACFVIGCLLSCVLWFSTPATIEHITEERPATAIYGETGTPPEASMNIRVTLDAGPLQSTIIRAAPPTCLKKIFIHDIPIDIRPLIGHDQCYTKPVTINIAPYKWDGVNQMVFRYEGIPKGNTRLVYSMHSTGYMLLIALCPFACLLLSRAQRQRAAARRVLQWLRYRPNYIALTISLLAMAIFLRIITLDAASRDFIKFFQKWMLHLRYYGLEHAYARLFSDYAPLYSYLLGIGDLILPTAPALYIVKFVSFLGEALAAFWVYRICTLYYGTRRYAPVLAALVLLCTPSVIINGAVIAQSDIGYTAFLLGFLNYMLRGQPVKALLCAGLAMSFKFMAIFLAPLALIYLLRGAINWRLLLIVPAVYAATCLPAWLEGTPFIQLAGVYWSKFSQSSVNINAANPYIFLNGFNREAVKAIGVCSASLCAALLVFISYRRWNPRVSPVLAGILLATLFGGLMPYLLPGMHDRYFMAADVFSVLLAALLPRWFMIPVLFQAATLMVSLDWQFEAVAQWGRIHWPQSDRLTLAMCCNAIAIGQVLWLCYAHIWRHSPPEPLSESAEP
jgi:Gpi18-like mannosyltransferase